MNLLFQTNQLCLQGTEVAVYDYAHFNETILNNKSYIIYDKNHPHNDNLVVQKFSSRFPDRVFSYENFDEFDIITKEKNIDLCYFIKSGENDGKLSKVKPNAVHTVFQNFEPHGDAYAYVSQWLSDVMTDGKFPYVPHIVHLPKPNQNIREQLGVPDDAFLFCRYGGLRDFDIDFVKKVVIEFIQKHEWTWFVFFNTIPFVDHPRIKFFGGFADLQLKANLIESCDAMIHARYAGETFGLAICEFLYGNKPVLSWNDGHGKNHIEILKNSDCLYNSEEDLYEKMYSLASKQRPKNNYKKLVENFSPECVMDKFNEVFIKKLA